jgi:hypothetical protein
VNKLEEVRPHAANGRADMFDIIRLSRDIMASAVSEWLRSASRCQGDAIRFVKDCFDRDIAAVSELAACKNAQEVIGLNATVVSNLVSEHVAEGARVFALYADDRNPLPAAWNMHRDRIAPRIDDRRPDMEQELLPRPPRGYRGVPGTASVPAGIATPR